MNWSVATAKQGLSEVIRQAANEPQRIYSRDRLAAVLVSAADFEAFEQAKAASEKQATLSVWDRFQPIRQALLDEGIDFTDPSLERHDNRPNAFVQMLEEEYPDDEPLTTANKNPLRTRGTRIRKARDAA
jgi:prevent-host-death family protein